MYDDSVSIDLPLPEGITADGRRIEGFDTSELGCTNCWYLVTKERRLLKFDPSFVGHLGMMKRAAAMQGDQSMLDQGVHHDFTGKFWIEVNSDNDAPWLELEFHQGILYQDIKLLTLTDKSQAVLSRLGANMARTLYNTSNRKGFMRRILEKQEEINNGS